MIQCTAVLTTVAGQHMCVCNTPLEDICVRHCEDMPNTDSIVEDR